MECRHLDGDRGNNARANLAWGTRAENRADIERHGTWPRGSLETRLAYDKHDGEPTSGGSWTDSAIITWEPRGPATISYFQVPAGTRGASVDG